MRKVAAIAAVLWGTAGLARATTFESFLGWSKDGSYSIVLAETEGGWSLRFCRSGAAAQPTWPSNLGSPDSDGCLIINDGDSGTISPTGAHKLVVLPKPQKLGPGGLKLSVHFQDGIEGPAAQVSIAAGKQKHELPSHFLQGPTSGYRLADVFWRADGRAVALQLDATPAAHGPGFPGARDVIIGDLVELGLAKPAVGPPAGDRKAAQAALNRGLAHEKKREWPAAIQAFADAVNLDPGFALAHYDLAALASRTGDLGTCLGELHWLAQARDKAAQAALKKAAGDPDFDYASTDEEARKALGLRPWPELTPQARLEERSGVWSSEGDSCGRPALTVTFKKGLVTLKVHGECDGKRSDASFKGKQKLNPDGSVSARFDGQKGLPAELGEGFRPEPITCPGYQVEGACFDLDPEDSNPRIFHRGLPEIAGGLTDVREGNP